MEIEYIGEHILFGQAGRFFIYLSFFAAIVALFAFFRASHEQTTDSRLWRYWGRRAFYFHTIMLVSTSAVLLWMLLNRYYEYRYVWMHIENNLGLGYKIAAFWAGQEGSLLFWILCQAFFGVLLIKHARKWENPVMMVMSFSQAFMLTLVMGLQIGGLSIGTSPFALLRETMGESEREFFTNPHYLALIVDGNGLNPLLRNIWMMSHPPFTFIGYASVCVPFCFAIAGLWKKRYHEWIKPALPWTALGVFFLGTGIILGGVWAYESLTFGGFWAWDPIENASLVPWLILVAALHLMLISYKRKNNFFPTFLFTILSFVLVVYATYLTRSGVLADTSVHSFGNDGMGRHILIYIFSIIGIAGYLIIINYTRLPSKDSDEPFTREFWLFIGSLVMVLSAFQIVFTTSMPVINYIFGTEYAPPIDVVAFYNTWQLPFAVVIALVIGITHFIKWGKNNMKAFMGSIFLSILLALVTGIVITLLTGMRQTGYLLMLFSSLFALFSSLDMLLRFRKNISNMGSVITHLGVALFLFAVLITFSGKETISQNTSGFFMGQQFREDENLLLMKDEILPMGQYHVVYTGRQFDGERIRYQIDFLKQNRDEEFYRAFSSFPTILLNKRMGNVYEPYSRVYLSRDIFTHITFADVENDMHSHSHTDSQSLTIALQDTINIDNNKIILKSIESSGQESGEIDPNDIRVSARLEIITHFGQIYELEPVLKIKEGIVIHDDEKVQQLDMVVRFKWISDTPNTIELEIIREKPEFIIIKTTIFPAINLLWFSMLVMLTGIWVSFRYRWRRKDVSSRNTDHSTEINEI